MNIFAYGTLVCPEMVFALTGKSFRSKKAVLKNYKRYGIYDNGVPRAYPAVKWMEGENVEGLLWYGVDENSFRILDFYEGHEYVRKEMNIDLHDGSKEKAFVYLWDTAFVSKLKNEWSLESFIANDLGYYLNEIVPAVLDELNPHAKTTSEVGKD